MYIETEYSGGMGAQGAALFAGGILQWKQTASTNNQPVRLLSKTPISRGLAELGVPPSLNRDEFDCVDLVRFRSLKDLGLEKWYNDD